MDSTVREKSYRANTLRKINLINTRGGAVCKGFLRLYPRPVFFPVFVEIFSLAGAGDDVVGGDVVGARDGTPDDVRVVFNTLSVTSASNLSSIAIPASPLSWTSVSTTESTNRMADTGRIR